MEQEHLAQAPNTDIDPGTTERLYEHMLCLAHEWARRGLAWNRDADATHNRTIRGTTFRITHAFDDGPDYHNDKDAAGVLITALPTTATPDQDHGDYSLAAFLVIFGHDDEGTVYHSWKDAWNLHEDRLKAVHPRDVFVDPDDPSWPIFAIVSNQDGSDNGGPPFYRSLDAAESYRALFGCCDHIVSYREVYGARCPQCNTALALIYEEPQDEMEPAMCLSSACRAEVVLRRTPETGVMEILHPGTLSGRAPKWSKRAEAARERRGFTTEDRCFALDLERCMVGEALRDRPSVLAAVRRRITELDYTYPRPWSEGETSSSIMQDISDVSNNPVETLALIALAFPDAVQQERTDLVLLMLSHLDWLCSLVPDEI